MPLVSPITGSTNVSVMQTIDVDQLVAEYKKSLGVDVSKLVGNYKTIQQVRCNDSGFRFYEPSDIVGDSDFYHQLEVHPWYYMSNKWEFDEAIAHISGQNVLEIGAAKGDFLKKVLEHDKNAHVVGLELNEAAAQVAQAHGLPVFVEDMAAHARTHPRQYDVVAAFQVLEHIAHPLEFLQSAIALLKPGGKLIIAVPDNSQRAHDSLFVSPNSIANMPPHHQGLWDVLSLSYLQQILPLKLLYIATEPATASYLSNRYRGLMKADIMQRFGPVLGTALYALGRPFYDHALKHVNKYLPAHTVLAVFQETTA